MPAMSRMLEGTLTKVHVPKSLGFITDYQAPKNLHKQLTLITYWNSSTVDCRNICNRYWRARTCNNVCFQTCLIEIICRRALRKVNTTRISFSAVVVGASRGIAKLKTDSVFKKRHELK